MAHDIAQIFKMPEEKVVHVKDRAFNDRRYYICDNKLNALGWAESTPWEEGLKKTVDWYLYNGFAGCVPCVGMCLCLTHDGSMPGTPGALPNSPCGVCMMSGGDGS